MQLDVRIYTALELDYNDLLIIQNEIINECTDLNVMIIIYHS
jgi:hypothetical protein